MGNRETVGVVVILAGVLLIVGAVRGTWGKLFKDVVLAQPSGATTTTAAGAGVGQQAGTTLSAGGQSASGPQVGELVSL